MIRAKPSVLPSRRHLQVIRVCDFRYHCGSLIAAASAWILASLFPRGPSHMQ